MLWSPHISAPFFPGLSVGTGTVLGKERAMYARNFQQWKDRDKLEKF